MVGWIPHLTQAYQLVKEDTATAIVTVTASEEARQQCLNSSLDICY